MLAESAYLSHKYTFTKARAIFPLLFCYFNCTYTVGALYLANYLVEKLILIRKILSNSMLRAGVPAQIETLQKPQLARLKIQPQSDDSCCPAAVFCCRRRPPAVAATRSRAFVLCCCFCCCSGRTPCRTAVFNPLPPLCSGTKV